MSTIPLQLGVATTSLAATAVVHDAAPMLGNAIVLAVNVLCVSVRSAARRRLDGLRTARLTG
jgi:hypothetical protein